VTDARRVQVVRNCLRFLRVRYQLDETVDVDYLERQFPSWSWTVQDFSSFVSGAMDHFIMEHAGVRVTGVLGGRELVVDFARTAGRWPTEALTQFEARL
jgi:hypothetical protein